MLPPPPSPAPDIDIPGTTDVPPTPGTFNPPGSSNVTPGTSKNPYATGGKPIQPQPRED
jgi:hypothetical protein